MRSDDKYRCLFQELKLFKKIANTLELNIKSSTLNFEQNWVDYRWPLRLYFTLLT